MKKPIYIILLILFLIGIPLFFFMALNTSVSIKYETELGDCISQVSGVDLCTQHDIYMGLSYLCILLFLLFLVFHKKLIKKKIKSDFTVLNRSFDELKFQFEKGLTIENHKDGIRYFGLEKVKDWKSKYGYVFNIYSNDHFIDNKPHFHFDNKEKGIFCKISFDGEIFESKGKNEIDKKVFKELKYFLSLDKTQEIIISKWNEKNPKLKASTQHRL